MEAGSLQASGVDNGMVCGWYLSGKLIGRVLECGGLFRRFLFFFSFPVTGLLAQTGWNPSSTLSRSVLNR
jgi:hypothetical protein